MTTSDPERPNPRGHMVLVLGMHRSGTSALSGVLHHLGCRLPDHQMQANESNPRGYFESESLRRFNDRLLADCGSQWNDWRPLPEGWFRSPEGQARLIEARDLLRREFDGAALAVLKDPRICRMVPFWQEAIAAAGFRAMPVLTFRNPLEVARSLSQRNEMDLAEVLLIWLRHVLDAEAATRGAPRQVTSYERLLGNWAGVAEGLQETFGLSLPRFDADAAAGIEDFLAPELRHHVEDADRITDNPILLSWVRETYRVLDRWTTRSERKADHALLDRLRGEFDAAAPAFAPLAGPTGRAARERATLRERVAELEEAVQDRDTATERLRAELSAAQEAADLARTEEERRVAALETETRDLRDRLEAAQAERTQAEEQAAGARDRLTRSEAEMGRLSDLLETAQGAQARAEDQAAAAAEDRAALRDRLSETESALAQRQLEAEQATFRAEEAERAGEAAAARRDELEAESLRQMHEMGRMARAMVEAETAAEARLSEETARWQAELETRSREAEGLRAEAEGLRAEAEGLRAEAERGRVQLEAASAERDAARAEAAEAEAARANLEAAAEGRHREMGRMADLMARSRRELETLRHRQEEEAQARRQLEADLQSRDEAGEAREAEWQARYEAERMRLEAEVTALRSSTSWRLTAPLRAVVDRLRGNR